MSWFLIAKFPNPSPNPSPSPKKCLGTGLHPGVPADPQLKIVGLLMKWIGKEPFKFKLLCTVVSDEAVQKLIMKKVEEIVLMADKMLLGGAQKMDP